MNRVVVIVAAALLAISAAEARAQSSSLLGDPGERKPLTLPENSWTYQAMEEPRIVQLNDLITVLVDEKSQVLSDGSMDGRKKADGSLSLTDWILLKGFWVVPDPQSYGDPTISGKMDNKYRAEGELESRESMKFRITCRVVDIRPNGNLVLEGRRTILNNEESWEMSLSGETRPEDILPNNTVFSESVAELRINKRETGHVRDRYRRGWLLRWLDKYQPI